MFHFLTMKDIFKTSLKTPTSIKFYLKDSFLFIKSNQEMIGLNITSTPKSSFRLFQKTLIGVYLRFVVRLVFIGVGFRVESIENNFLKLKLGFSHFVFLKIPTYIKIEAPKKTSLVLSSLNNALLGEFVSRLRSFRLPDVYKGKGISFKNQILIFKEGKKK